VATIRFSETGTPSFAEEISLSSTIPSLELANLVFHSI